LPEARQYSLDAVLQSYSPSGWEDLMASEVKRGR
jgi:hypothetical protein